MNLAQKESLALMDEFLSNLSVDEFLADYLEIEDFEGVTVDEFNALPILQPSMAISEFYHTTLARSVVTRASSSAALKVQAVDVAPLSGTSKLGGSFDQSANDSVYSLAA